MESQTTQAVDSTENVVAKATTETTTETTDSGNQEPSWSTDQKVYIDNLRKENAKYRTKSKELETQYTGLSERFSKVEKGLKGMFGDSTEDDMPPEKKLEAIQSQNEQLVLNNALTEAALEYGILKEDFSYFKFLVQEKLGGLEDGGELTEEDLDVIAKSARRSRATSTSVEEGGAAPEQQGGISLEQFSAMGINERSLLFSKNEALYKQLVSQERSAKVKK